MAKLNILEIQNYRSIESLRLPVQSVNVLFGPNGAGKSSILDTIWFLKDCIIRGVEEASADRNHGLGLRWDSADNSAAISIGIKAEQSHYTASFGFSSGRIEPFAGEVLYGANDTKLLIERKIASDQATFYHYKTKENIVFPLRDPEKLALTRYIDFESHSAEAEVIANLLYSSNFYHARSADLHRLKKFGSESNHHTHLYGRCQNLWSVLRNLDARRSLDDRYVTIIDYMRESFPSFKDLFLEQTGPNIIYGNFVEKGRRGPIRASGVSDGHLQLLVNLTALLSTGNENEAIVLFDEPEISLHPHALGVFAKAVRFAVEHEKKQVFIATHSPVLLSHFEPTNIFAVGTGEYGQTTVQQVSEIAGIQDLLEEYATGSLYMAGVLAPQDRQK